MGRVFAALLGVTLVVVWVLGLIYHAPRWLVWSDAGVAFITLAGLAAEGSSGMEGVVTWPFAGVGLWVVWLFARVTRAPGWITWLNFGLGCAFVIITVTLFLPRVNPTHFPRGRRHGK